MAEIERTVRGHKIAWNAVRETGMCRLCQKMITKEQLVNGEIEDCPRGESGLPVGETAR